MSAPFLFVNAAARPRAWCAPRRGRTSDWRAIIAGVAHPSASHSRRRPLPRQQDSPTICASRRLPTTRPITRHCRPRSGLLVTWARPNSAISGRSSRCSREYGTALAISDCNSGISVLPCCRRRVARFERLDAQVVAAHLVQHDHVERRRRGALLVEAAHVEALGIGTPVDDLVHRALVAMEGEDHRLVRR